VWTHANALWAARVNALHEDLHPSSCHLTYLPLFHANALGYQMLTSMWVGARFVLVPKWSTREETGHLLVHGTPGLSLFAGYLNQPEATEDSYDEAGWFRTGDRATIHSDGYLTFADRAKDMLKVGAENVRP